MPATKSPKAKQYQDFDNNGFDEDSYDYEGDIAGDNEDDSKSGFRVVQTIKSDGITTTTRTRTLPQITPMKDRKNSIAKGRKQRKNLKFTDEELEAALIECKGLISNTAKKLKVTWKGVKDRIDKDPERFMTIVKAGREAVIDKAERTLESMMNSPDHRIRLEAAKFTLVTIGKNRGFTTRQEISGPEGSDLVLVLRPPVRTD